MSLDNEINSLIHAILESEQYKNYQRAMMNLSKDEELLKKVNAFRKQRLLLESQAKGNNYPHHELKAVQESYSSLIIFPLAADFLEAEKALSQMLLKIYKNIAEALDFNLDFLNQ
jgi:cell fate (sporulation/competence/biofilm development) regulator YlbF (YheA/YmcA/DUF963 family)